MQPKSLCFLEASQEEEKGNITWEQYIHNLVIHCTAKNLHPPDVEWWKRGTDWELLRADPFAYSIMTWSRQIRDIKDTTRFENIFNDYHNNASADVIKAKLDQLKEVESKSMRVSLVVLALQDRRAPVLKVCLEQLQNFPAKAYHRELVDQVEEGKDPETFKVLQQTGFRKRCDAHYDYKPWNIVEIGSFVPIKW